MIFKRTIYNGKVCVSSEEFIYLLKQQYPKVTVDLRNCKKGDILISSQGAKLEYIAPTPWKNYTYLDHVVRYIEDANGKSFGDKNYGTRTNDGFVFAENRKPETDHDIVINLSLDKSYPLTPEECFKSKPIQK
jgi:hypothetical protein